MSSGDDRSGPEGTNDKTSNSNNLNTVTKYNIILVLYFHSTVMTQM
jgi:hypothetical protein